MELTPKSIPFEAFDEIHQVAIDIISENMAPLVQPGMYGAINTADNKTNVFYVIQYISEAYMLQNDTTIDVQIIYAGELFFKAQYLFIYAIKHQLVLETTTTATDHNSPNTHNNSSTP